MARRTKRAGAGAASAAPAPEEQLESSAKRSIGLDLARRLNWRRLADGLTPVVKNACAEHLDGEVRGYDAFCEELADVLKSELLTNDEGLHRHLEDHLETLASTHGVVIATSPDAVARSLEIVRDAARAAIDAHMPL